MRTLKDFFKFKRNKVWFIVTCSVAVFMVIVNVAAMLLQSLIGTIGLGRDRPILGDGVEALYVAETSSKEDALENAKQVNLTANREGIVLLKNEKSVLPLKKGDKVSVFGKNSTNIVYGGTGSGAGDTKKAVTLYESLDKAGIKYNEDLKKFYENDSKSGNGRPDSGSIDNVKQTMITGETPLSKYSGNLAINKSNYSDYKIALVVISRVGGENTDVPRTTVNSKGVRAEGAREGFDDHFLQLDQNEADMLKAVCEVGFEKVVLIVNSSNAMELGFLKNGATYATDKGYDYDYASKIDGALWIGGPGINGLIALREVLVGDINPSGRLVDTYSMDFTKDPTWENFGNNLVFDTDKTFAGNRYTINGSGGNAYEYGVEYEEGIYVGYKYFETRGYTDGDDWYEKNVVYPFGYGLSYTEFEWKIQNKADLLKKTLTKETFTVTVEVTNTGSVAGKDVVELYVTAPYTAGGIEKSHVALCGFAKTEIIEPGATKTVEIEVDPYSFACYDYNDANINGFKGYELEKGNYIFHVSKNAHDWKNEDLSFTLNQAEESIRYDKDAVTGYSVVNLYDDADDTLETVLSRSDWTGTMPARPTAAENAADGLKYHAAFSDRSHNNPTANSITEMPKQAKTKPRTEDGKATVNLRHLVGADYDGKEWADTWNTVLDSIMVKDMLDLYTNGNFRSVAIDYIYKNETIESDGPAGFTNFMDPELFKGVCVYASECLFACTWNADILEEFGKAVGEESLQGNGAGIPYSGWYAPGVNIHRSPFGGRNYEYFSEDAYLTATLAAREVKGARSKGVTVYVKHFAVNDQETNRQGVAAWLTEQALREIYLKPFEYCVKEGCATGIMSSFNRIGTRWTGGDYRLLTEILRNEWGFNGTVITDFNTIPDFMDVKQAIYAGGDLDLATTPHTAWFNENSAADVTMLRRATKNILYSVVNSNAMNADIQGYAPAYWKICLWVFDAVLAVAFIIWGVNVILKSNKENGKY